MSPLRMRSRCLLAAVAILSIPVLSACTSSHTGSSAKSITWYTSMQAEDAQPIMDAFTKQTGTKVSLYTAATPTVWQRLQQEESSGRHTADVFTITDDSIIQSAINSKYIAKLPAGAASGYPTEYVDPNGYWLSLRVTIIGIVYNTKIVTGANVPTTWADLAKPYFKGKLNVTDPQLTTTGYFADWQVGHAPGLGQSFLTSLGAQKPAILAHSGQQVNDVISGDSYAAITSDDAVWPQIQTGAPIKMVYPSGGVANYADYTGVVADAPNAAGANAFVKFLSTPTAGNLIAKTGAYSPVPGVDAQPSGRPPLSSLTLFPPDMLNALSSKTSYLATLKQLGLATTS